jgi:hypothetical protein
MKPMDLKISRRELALAVTSAAAVAAQPQPQTPLPQNPQEELAAARQQTSDNSAALTKFDIRMAVEPAVHFRA